MDRMSNDEIRRAEGIDPSLPTEQKIELLGSMEEVMDGLNDFAKKVLSEKMIPERLEAAQEELGIITDSAIEKLARSSAEKVYIEQGRKNAELVLSIRDLLAEYADRISIDEFRQRFDKIRQELREFSEQHNADDDYMEQETLQANRTIDALKILQKELRHLLGL